MARKIDWSKGKELMFNHGEKIALGTCAGLALLLGLWGLISATSAGRVAGGKTFPEEFKFNASRIKEGMDRAPEPTFDTKIFDRVQYVWGPYTSKHVPSRYAELGENGNDKRGKPRVLPIRSDPKKPEDVIRLDYLAGLTYAHDHGLDARNKQVIRGRVTGDVAVVAPEKPLKKKEVVVAPAEPLPPLVHVGVPTRMVIVHAIFPMRQQVEEFRKALRMLDQSDLFVKNRADLPQPLGIDVLKFEVSPKGEIAKPEVLLGFDKSENTFHMNARLEEVLRQSIYDERAPEAFKSFLWNGLCTPVPKLANRPYPNFTLPGFDDIDWAALEEPEKKEAGMAAGGGFVPPQKGEGGGIRLPGLGKEKPPPMNQPPEPGKEPGVEYKVKEIFATEAARIDPILVSRLFPGKEKRIDLDMNVYHVLGKKPTDRNAAANVPATPNLAEGDRFFAAWDIDPPKGAEPGVAPQAIEGKVFIKPKIGPEAAASVSYPAWERDALVRFIDVDVKPGYSYFYAVRVRLANPNFGKEAKEVQFARLAANPELDPSDWVETPRISIPEEYHLYAVDQKLMDDLAEGKVTKGAGPLYKPEVVAREAAFQVHQWVPGGSDLLVAGAEPYVIGDWVISERQNVRKGEYIGRGNVLLAPTWNKLRDAFEVPLNKDPDPKAKSAPKGLHLDLLKEYRTPIKDGDEVKWKVERKAPVLVDFTGGKRLNRGNQLEEETAVDALVLMPDGKLKVLNSREAADAKDRQERVVQNRARIAEIMRGGGGGGVPSMPKDGPKLPGPGPKRPGGSGG